MREGKLLILEEGDLTPAGDIRCPLPQILHADMVVTHDGRVLKSRDGHVGQITKPLKRFLVSERMACWVTFTREIEAEDSDQALDKFVQGDHGVEAQETIGDGLDFMETSYEVEEIVDGKIVSAGGETKADEAKS